MPLPLCNRFAVLYCALQVPLGIWPLAEGALDLLNELPGTRRDLRWESLRSLPLFNELWRVLAKAEFPGKNTKDPNVNFEIMRAAALQHLPVPGRVWSCTVAWMCFWYMFSTSVFNNTWMCRHSVRFTMAVCPVVDTRDTVA